MNSSLENKIVTFDSSKQFKYIKNLGRGGTGDTNLFLDESVDMLFAIKKYSPSIETVFEQLNFEFGNEGKVHFLIGTEEQQKFLNQMRSLANDKEAFLTTMEPIVEKCGKAEKVKCINS